MPKPGRPPLYGQKMINSGYYMPRYLRKRIKYHGGGAAVREWGEGLPPSPDENEPDKKEKL